MDFGTRLSGFGILASSLISCVTMGKLLNVSVSQFAQLSNGIPLDLPQKVVPVIHRCLTKYSCHFIIPHGFVVSYSGSWLLGAFAPRGIS